ATPARKSDDRRRRAGQRHELSEWKHGEHVARRNRELFARERKRQHLDAGVRRDVVEPTRKRAGARLENRAVISRLGSRSVAGMGHAASPRASRACMRVISSSRPAGSPSLKGTIAFGSMADSSRSALLNARRAPAASPLFANAFPSAE